jgi:phospholipid transport system substrate-binding protein
MKLRRVAVSAFASVVLLMGTAGASEDPPSTVIGRFHETLIGVMKESQQLAYQQRFDRLAPAVTSTYDLDFMASKAVGSHWSQLGTDGQQRWLQAFRRFTIANYAGRFDGYSGQSFETLGEEPGANETAVVRTVLRNPSSTDVQLNYRMRRTPAGWRVIDVYLNGSVSELALRRAEYTAAFDRNGLDEVLATLENKIDDLSADAGN